MCEGVCVLMYIISDSGSVFVWGSNEYCQLGLPSTHLQVHDVYCM